MHLHLTAPAPVREWKFQLPRLPPLPRLRRARPHLKQIPQSLERGKHQSRPWKSKMARARTKLQLRVKLPRKRRLLSPGILNVQLNIRVCTLFIQSCILFIACLISAWHVHYHLLDVLYVCLNVHCCYTLFVIEWTLLFYWMYMYTIICWMYFMFNWMYTVAIPCLYIMYSSSQTDYVLCTLCLAKMSIAFLCALCQVCTSLFCCIFMYNSILLDVLFV